MQDVACDATPLTSLHHRAQTSRKHSVDEKLSRHNYAEPRFAVMMMSSKTTLVTSSIPSPKQKTLVMVLQWGRTPKMMLLPSSLITTLDKVPFILIHPQDVTFARVVSWYWRLHVSSLWCRAPRICDYTNNDSVADQSTFRKGCEGRCCRPWILKNPKQ